MTICSHERHLLFEEEQIRQVIDWAWNQISIHFPFATTDAFVIMPNHVHGVLFFDHGRQPSMVGAQHAGRLPSNPRPSATTLSGVIRSFKAAVTRELRVRGLWDDGPFWQPGYYDRVVRNEQELNRVREYIAHNPVAWQYDHENPVRQHSDEHTSRWAWLENAPPQP